MLKLCSHITLSVLLLLSATGMTINLHYCHDQLIDLALIAPAKSCCEADLLEDNCHQNMSISNTNHCNDETIKFETANDYVVSGYSFSFENAHSFELFYTTPVTIYGEVLGEYSKTTFFNIKKPPNPREVVLSQIQSFLI